MAAIFNVSRSGYYKWLNKTESKNQRLNSKLGTEIKSIQEKIHYSLGAVKMTEKLREMGYLVNHKRISRIMKINSLNFKPKKRFKICIASRNDDTYASNLLDRKFTVSQPNKVWVSDITYIQTSEGWLYLCVIIDLFSRKVVGYSADKSMGVDLVLSAFWMAVKLRKPNKELLFHSDRGTQYCSIRFRNALSSLEMIQSMSRKGNCWDNACAETFFRSFKNEWFYDVGDLNREKVKSLIFEYIQVFYNKFRPHYSLGLKSPDEFENKIA